MKSRLGVALAALTSALLAGCVGTPRVSGVPGASPAPEKPWTPPAGERKTITAADTSAQAAVPPDLADRIRRLTLAEIVDLGLRNNPQTRLAWANAQASAAAYGSARGEWLPTVDGDVTAQRIKTVASAGRVGVQQSVITPSATLSYLLFDFGGRSGRVAGARERLIAAGFTHNAAIQDVVLQIQVGYFQYIANRALLEAQRTTLAEARANLEAAEERRRVGLATIADVLQARTAASQAQLDLQTTEGSLQTARGALALALGLPANLPYDVDSSAAVVPVAPLADSVDALIASALRGRPDLAAAQAEAAAARAGIGELRSDLLPSLQLSATGGRTYATTIPNGANSYNLSLGLTIPLFNGFSRQYDLRGARFQAEAAEAQTQTLRQQVVYQVFSAYYALQTANGRVRTTNVLITSAEQSSEVALARYKAGVGTVLDLLSAQSALANARAQRVDARLAWSVSLAQLAHDAGVLDPRGEQPAPALQRYHDGYAHDDDLPPRTHDSPLLSLLALASCGKSDQAGAGRRPGRGCPGGAPVGPFELAAPGVVEPHPDGGGAAAGERADRAHNVSEGQEVRKGQVLFRSTPVPSRPRWHRRARRSERDSAQAASAEQDVQRYSALAEKEYVTAQQYDQARAAAAAAERDGEWQPGRGGPGATQPAVRHDPGARSRGGREASGCARETSCAPPTPSPLVTINQIRPILVRLAVPAANLGLIQRYQTDDPSCARSPPGAGPERRRPVVRGQRGGFHHRHHPAQGLLSQPGRRALAGRVRQRAGPSLRGQECVGGPGVGGRLRAAGHVRVRPAAGQHRKDPSGQGGAQQRQRRHRDGGLSPGDRVVTDGQLRLRSGSKVQIKSSGDSVRAGES